LPASNVTSSRTGAPPLSTVTWLIFNIVEERFYIFKCTPPPAAGGLTVDAVHNYKLEIFHTYGRVG
ncbi:MAG: hypothetical protein QXD08_09010, partial [Pyrobaculum sp.]